MIEIEIAYDDREARRALDRLRAAGRDLTPVMRRIAGHLSDSVAESFERQAEPGSGLSWTPLAEDTKHERRQLGYGDGAHPATLRRPRHAHPRRLG